MRIDYEQEFASDREWATVTDDAGFYVCTVDRCSCESQERFRHRARMIADALDDRHAAKEATDG